MKLNKPSTNLSSFERFPKDFDVSLLFHQVFKVNDHRIAHDFGDFSYFFKRIDIILQVRIFILKGGVY